MKKNIFGIVLFSALFILSGCQNQSVSSDENASAVFFYGKDCSHCKVVEKYIDDNKTREKFEFSEKEVSGNKGDANLMVKRQKECGLDSKVVGSVPFLWTKEGKCYSGSDEIIKFFESKTKTNEQ